MTTFNQQGQHVSGSQQNIGTQKIGTQINVTGEIGEINFGSVHSRKDVITQVQKLPEVVNKLFEAGIIDDEIAIEVEYRIKKAVQETRKDTPDKKTVVDYLDQAKELVTGITSAAGLLTALNHAIKAVLAFF